MEQNRRRSRMKLGVFCVLAVGVCGLTAMLIQGCKREQSAENAPLIDTNPPAMLIDTNPPAMTNPPMVAPMVPTNPPMVAPVVPVAPEATGTEYVVVKGDTLGNIAKRNHISLKALEAANPNVTPTKLKVGQKLTIPAGATPAPTATGTSATPDMTGATGGGETYTVKAGDTLTKIARAHGTTVKAIEEANNLSTTKIKVGQKLKLPASAVATAPAAAPAPAAPVMPVAPVTAPATTPAPAGTPGGQ